MARKDPIGPAFYVPLSVAEKISEAVFYVAGALSVLVLLVDGKTQPLANEILQATFAVSVVAIFATGIVIRVYFATRAHAKRVADFVSNAFNVPLLPNLSEGYYNTPDGDAYVRMGASLLENTLFTKSILARMLLFERSRAGLYICVWIWALSYRAANLELVAIAAQVLFSEQLLSRWIRMEWLRLRAERLYDDVYALFQATADTATVQFRARVIEALIRYETSKAQAGVSLSSRAFKRLNPDLSSAWLKATRQLGLTLPATPGADPVP